MAEYVDVVMTVAPHANGEFVELEDNQGGPTSEIRWIKPTDSDPYWRLRIPWDAIGRVGDEIPVFTGNEDG